MSIQTYTSHEKLSYKYAKNGAYKVSFANNVSSAVFTGAQINGLKKQLTYVKNLDQKFTKLGDSAFAGCSILSAVNFNSTITSIGADCFNGCTNISYLHIPPNIVEISSGAFENMTSLTSLGFDRFENDTTGLDICQLARLGDSVLAGSTKCTSLILPKSVNSLDKIASNFLSGSSITELTLLGVNSDASKQLTATTGLNAGHDFIAYTSDNKAMIYQKQTNSVVEDTAYSAYKNMKLFDGTAGKMQLSRKIYKFDKDLIEWCTDPTKQEQAKFPQRECPVITIFCDLNTSLKSNTFADNVLRQAALYSWMAENLKCYVFLMDRNGQISDSDSSTNLKYYRTKFNALGAKNDFVTVNFLYKTQFNSVTLSDLTLTGFENTVLEYCKKTGFDNFDPTGYEYATCLDPETVPSKSVDTDSVKAIHSDGFDWYQDETAKATQWDIQSDPIDFNLVATPATTYLVVCSYDKQLNYDPKEIWSKLYPILSQFADNTLSASRCNSNKKKFLTGLTEGLKYRYLIFYEFSHGGLEDDGSAYITIDGKISQNELWQALAPAKNRIFGMIDSCYSGLMLKSEATSSSLLKTSSVSNGNIAEFLINKFNQRKLLAAGSSADSTTDPYILVWSSTGSGLGYYEEDYGFTYFQRAICKAFDSVPNGRYSELWPLVYKYGHAKSAGYTTYAEPQQKTYNVDFTKNKAFT